ncbi:nucleotidyl transferase AbiEii/AbiGii toxin family protein [Phytoactinopolyspora halotolerans]|uniref:Nucleotidyl transferase AbiEii/AbiGii toxin family protein n=1 Tax=Phytoactinopolyspora halotolerans TaxID=1981512 RepID=A0A6L9SAK4_9ACTN|nr:nucleotidyl transferase AbiEii/AbiGii toxin family protein [Phytoactinopolyspora halotolerans]NEE02395.1 nucleotidyl transferase AbiEii/AbiGii toxin family protein [Phytoactinopolyspora halotolerans]
MHLVRVAVVCAMLDAVRHDDGGHLFIVKGGTAMQLRLGIRARATTDLDVIFRGHMDTWLHRFDEAIAERTWNGFTVERKAPPLEIDVPGLGYRPWRVALQIRYEGRDFGSTSLEVAIDERTGKRHTLVQPQGIVLAEFDIDPPRLVPCLDVPYQIAQKLHACTEPHPDGNDRVRDLIDIWLLEGLLAADDLQAVRDAAIETFSRRASHAWPPIVKPSPSWAHDYPLLVREHPEAPADLDEAIRYLTDFIHRIDNVPTR